MRILIKDPPAKLTATFETRGPPCHGCVFRQAPRDYDEVEACMMANQAVTGAVLKECSDKKWYKPRCSECGEPAAWVRTTQFSGDHAFCKDHAKAEADFGQRNEGYLFWEPVE